MEFENITNDDLLQDMVDWLGGPVIEPSEDDGWFTVNRISEGLKCDPSYARDLMNRLVKEGRAEIQEYKKRYYYRRLNGQKEPAETT